eukprot:COSAG02_NODE_5375_length_4384_cov_28.351773_2_plen_75_part_00
MMSSIIVVIHVLVEVSDALRPIRFWLMHAHLGAPSSHYCSMVSMHDHAISRARILQKAQSSARLGVILVGWRGA